MSPCRPPGISFEVSEDCCCCCTSWSHTTFQNRVIGIQQCTDNAFTGFFLNDGGAREFDSCWEWSIIPNFERIDTKQQGGSWNKFRVMYSSSRVSQHQHDCCWRVCWGEEQYVKSCRTCRRMDKKATLFARKRRNSKIPALYRIHITSWKGKAAARCLKFIQACNERSLQQR